MPDHSRDRDELEHTHPPETQRRRSARDLAPDPTTGLTGAAKVVTAVGAVGAMILMLGFFVYNAVEDGRARTKAAEDAHGKVGEMTEAIRGNTAKLDEVARGLRTLNGRLKELAPDERKAAAAPE